MVSTPRCGRGDPGSIPGCGKFKINLIAHTFVAMGYSAPIAHSFVAMGYSAPIAHTFVAMGYSAPIAQSVLLVLSNGDDSRAHA